VGGGGILAGPHNSRLSLRYAALSLAVVLIPCRSLASPLSIGAASVIASRIKIPHWTELIFKCRAANLTSEIRAY
jgi:hypothetical protein